MGEVLAVRDAYRAQEWAMLIQECNASGLTKRKFCQQRGISEKSFYYRLRKLRTQIAERAAPAGAAGVGSCCGRYAPDPVPGSGTETASRCGYGCRSISAKSAITTLPAATQIFAWGLTD